MREGGRESEREREGGREREQVNKREKGKWVKGGSEGERVREGERGGKGWRYIYREGEGEDWRQIEASHAPRGHRSFCMRSQVVLSQSQEVFCMGLCHQLEMTH